MAHYQIFNGEWPSFTSAAFEITHLPTQMHPTGPPLHLILFLITFHVSLSQFSLSIVTKQFVDHFHLLAPSLSLLTIDPHQKTLNRLK